MRFKIPFFCALFFSLLFLQETLARRVDDASPPLQTELGQGLTAEDYSDPVPLQTGDLSARKILANRIYFFRHPTLIGSEFDFGEQFSEIRYTIDGVDHLVRVEDLIGAPHPLYLDGRPQNSAGHLLEDPADLCFEDLVLNLSCSRDILTNSTFNKLSGSQLLGDLRNLKPGEENVRDAKVDGVILHARPYKAPYETHQLSTIIAESGRDFESFPSDCYDITATKDWIACPIFGKIFVNNGNKGMVELNSPIVLYRLKDATYQLAGYLGNPTAETYSDWSRGNVNPAMPLLNSIFPLAIESGNFYETKTGVKEEPDIAVFSTATLPRTMCKFFLDKLEAAGHQVDLPHRFDCSYGHLWGRLSTNWEQSLRKNFGPVGLFIAPPEVFDIAKGSEIPFGLSGANEKDRTVLFAASGKKAPDGKYYVYKYFEKSRKIFLNHRELQPNLPPLIIPEAIAVRTPVNNSGPFRIRTFDINKDGFSDFSLTWIYEKHEVDAVTLKRKGLFSPFVSIFTSRLNGNHIAYDQFDFQPADVEAQITSVDFGSRDGQDFLAAGDYRVTNEQSFVYTVPISGGLLETNKVSALRVDFSDIAGERGVGDVAVDKKNGLIASLLQHPFLRAPEGCDVEHAQVYGHHWFGAPNFAPSFFMGATGGLDHDQDGIPNRCECSQAFDNRKVYLLPNDTPGSPGFDNDMDEIPAQCDSCPDSVNIGDLDGDSIDDACDVCPARACTAIGKAAVECVNKGDRDRDGIEDACDNCAKFANPNQSDRDGDYTGDECDYCPDYFDPQQKRVYVFEMDRNGRRGDSCTDCRNAYIDREGHIQHPLGVETLGCETNRNVPQHDQDRDEIADAYDNCVFIRNWDQSDVDDDFDGDACDCAEGAPKIDDCDDDGVPNRFDSWPWDGDRQAGVMQQQPDSVYDPRAGYIADARHLKWAKIEVNKGIGVSVPTGSIQGPGRFASGMSGSFREKKRGVAESDSFGGSPPAIVPEPHCNFQRGVFPGLSSCVEIGGQGNDITILLPKIGEEEPIVPPPPPAPAPAPAPIPAPTPIPLPLPNVGGSLQQFCTARVGRADKRMVGPVAQMRDKIMEANNRVQEITGLKDFDIFVGADGGMIHWECYFAGGAAPNIAMAKNIIPGVSGNVASFGLWQIKGLPVQKRYDFASDPTDRIDSSTAMRLAPLEGVDSSADERSIRSMPFEGVGAAFKSALAGDKGLRIALPVPNVGALLITRNEQLIPTDNVQFGNLRQNINGNMVLKVLNSESDLAEEGVAFSVSDRHSIISIDYKTSPSPFTNIPVEDRPYALRNIDKTLKKLEALVDARQKRGEKMDVSIFRELAWGDVMHTEFLLAQETVPEALAGVSHVVGAAIGVAPDVVHVDPSAGATNMIILPAFAVEASLEVQGTGLCRLNAGAAASTATSASGVLLLFLLMPIPAFAYLRSISKK